MRLRSRDLAEEQVVGELQKLLPPGSSGRVLLFRLLCILWAARNHRAVSNSRGSCSPFAQPRATRHSAAAAPVRYPGPSPWAPDMIDAFLDEESLWEFEKEATRPGRPRHPRRVTRAHCVILCPEMIASRSFALAAIRRTYLGFCPSDPAPESRCFLRIGHGLLPSELCNRHHESRRDGEDF